ncbi:MAG: DUF4920 domain-containing protein [Deltaproteobacteria bacterium]|nr:DUF4920 domain-containing protein [Deltaproteobacteria bacterium]
MSIASHTCILLLLSASLAACDKSSANTAASRAPEPVAVAAAASTSPAALTGTTFGAGVKLAETTPISAVLADPKAFNGKTVRVEGMVTDVCPKRGCWFEMAGSAPGQKLRFKVTDGEMVFPPDSKGKTAVAEGVVVAREMSIEESKQFAEYQAKEYKIAYDPASITKPTVSVRIDGTGAVFK